MRIPGRYRSGDARCQAGEIAVGGDEAETVETAGVQQVHRIDDQSDIRGILAAGIGEVLVRLDRVPGEHVGPGFQSGSRKIAIDSPDARLPDTGDLLEQPGRDPGRRVVGVNQNRQSGGAWFGGHTRFMHQSGLIDS